MSRVGVMWKERVLVRPLVRVRPSELALGMRAARGRMGREMRGTRALTKGRRRMMLRTIKRMSARSESRG